MAAAASSHPTDQTLQSYGLGKLDDALAESVNKHLSKCAKCQRRVAELSSDSFLGRLRDVQGRLDPTGPFVSSLAGLSMLDDGPSSSQRPPSGTLPPGLADHPDYEVIRELGQGGMGTVYLAKNRLMGRHEVLKVVSGHLINRRGVMDRFLGEIRNAARLHHTNIVTAYSATRIGESIVFAMEYVDGLDLARLVKSKGALPVSNACGYVYQSALGLQHASEHGMVHRDIKPSNLMLAKQGSRGVIKVLDFGLAKVKSEGAVDGGLTQEGQMLGTPDYIAPEQIGDARLADIRADIYSLGCTLYYLLTGGPPFRATSLYEILQAHHSMDALPLNLARPEVPVELAALVARMMAKEPERRFQTPADVAKALTPFFKSGNTGIKGSNPEISRAGQPYNEQAPAGAVPALPQPATSRTTGAAPSTTKPPEQARSEAAWESLIAFKGAESMHDAAKPVMPRRLPWFWPSVAGGVLLLALCIGWALTVRFETGSQSAVVISARTQAILDALEKPVPMSFNDDTPLEDVIKYVRISTQGSIKSGVPIYVDPVGLQEAEKSMTSTIRNINLDGLPLSTTLRRVLKQLGLAYFVKDEIMIITSDDGLEGASKEPWNVLHDVSPSNNAILDLLDLSIPMHFDEDTPLQAVIEYVEKTAHHGDQSLARKIYVDPIGLQEAEKTMTSTVRNLDVEGVPLRTTLRLLLQQIGLAYAVEGGMLVITSAESIEKKYRAKKEGFVPLFNGKDLDGWQDLLPNGSKWDVVDGMLEGRGGGDKRPAVLATKRRDFVNYRLRAKVRYPQDGFGWIELRRTGADETMNGYIVAAGLWPTEPRVPAGSIGRATDYHYGTVFDWEKTAEEITHPANKWFTIEITVVKNKITIGVNEKSLTDYTDTTESYKSGAIALICSGNSIVQFESVVIEELPE